MEKRGRKKEKQKGCRYTYVYRSVCRGGEGWGGGGGEKR